MKKSADELPSWGPALRENRTGRYADGGPGSQYIANIEGNMHPLGFHDDVTKGHMDDNNVNYRRRDSSNAHHNDVGHDNLSFRF